MCGFCVSSAGKPQRAEALEAVLEPRGPDGRGEVLHGDCWLLHRRLAIIDPEATSAQPFRSGPADVAYNGEIYNYRDLRSRLPGGPTTVGDTEVFSYALSAMGSGPELLLPALRGMYAGAAVDGDTIRLTRDRFGIKPLYRAVDESGNLHVASQVRCFQHLLSRLTVDEEAVSCFRRFGNVHGGGTIFKEVKEVPAGTTETWRAGRLVSSEALPALESSGDLKEALLDAMSRHLVADTEIGILLSGGLDSATLAHLAKELGADPVCVTVSAVDGRDESADARRTAKRLGLRHEIIEVGGADIRDGKEEFIAAMDQPTIDGLNTFVVTRAVRDLGLKVALSGLGADELFGGYASFRRIWLTHRLRRLPRPVLRQLINRTGANGAKTARWLEARSHPGRLATISREVARSRQDTSEIDVEPPIPVGPSRDPVVNNEIWRYMSPTLLRDADAFSMANSVELRVPFLDDAVAAAAFARSTRDRAWRGKRAITECLGSTLLSEVQSRPKTGFEIGPVPEPADILSAWMAVHGLPSARGVEG